MEWECAGLGTEEIPRALTSSIPLSQDLPGPEAAAVPGEPKMLNASPPKMSGSPSSQEKPLLRSDMETPPQDKKVDVPSMEEENLAEQWIQEAQAQFSWENPLGSFLAKAQQADWTKQKGAQKQWK